MRVAGASRTTGEGEVVHAADADHTERSVSAEIRAGAQGELPAALRRRCPVGPAEIADLAGDLPILQHLSYRVPIGEHATIPREQLGRRRYRGPRWRSDRATGREEHSQNGQPSNTTQVVHGSLLGRRSTATARTSQSACHNSFGDPAPHDRQIPSGPPPASAWPT